MSGLLQALGAYYEQSSARGEADPPGWSQELISYALVVSQDGAPKEVVDLREARGRKFVPRRVQTPSAVKRTVAITPNLMWDKSAYVLGRTARDARRTAQEHAAFKTMHLDLLAGTQDKGLRALSCFLEGWTPDRFDAAPFRLDMLDANFVFQLEGDPGFMHHRKAARSLISAWSRHGEPGDEGYCLTTGARATIARLHPTIKGVDGAPSTGAAVVSFNLDAFTSYGRKQGRNAPTSEEAAFRYGAALNQLLTRGSPNRLTRPIGDATVVFWAQALESQGGDMAAAAAEAWFTGVFDPSAEHIGGDRTAAAAAGVRAALLQLAAGRPLAELEPRLDPTVRLHVLGLAPNAARLSVRFWISGGLEVFARRLGDHYADLSIDPSPWAPWPPPSIQHLLIKSVAAQERADKIPPQLAGDLMRSIMTGTAYPRTLLAGVLMRIRAGDDPSYGWHAAAVRAVLARAHRQNHPNERSWLMSLERDRDDPPYQLGRLFATLETAQRRALGKLNVTIRDSYFGAASATPARVFPLLMRGVQTHLAKLRKDGRGGWLEREIEAIVEVLPASLPLHLSLEGQGRFVIGYYHQRKAHFAGRPGASAENTPEDDQND